ncbi:hypothetical protein [Mesorhizobium sp. NPDC059025]|uniref:hypothetical protein n=1 Tax=unclassified Mesorhizobium TaxID=325217 RepID=UPI0036B13FA2
MQIEHDPNEQRPTNAIWWGLWLMVAFSWVGYLYFNSPDWWAIGLGGFTMGTLATFAIEKTGNKWPFS